MLITICRTNDGEDLLSMTVYMPSIEVGTIGGGAVLDLLGSVLEMLGIKGARYASPGQDAQRLACIISVMAGHGELSLLSALTPEVSLDHLLGTR